MARTLSTTAVSAGNSPETNEIFLYILEITHTNLATPIRVVNNMENIISNGLLYDASAFSFVPPTESDGMINPAKLVIDNVDRRVVEAVRLINSPANIKASVILASDPDTLEVGPFDLVLKNVTYNRNSVTGDLIYLQYLSKYASRFIMNNQNFPGLIEWT